MRKPKEPPRLILTILFSILTFFTLTITMIVVGTAVYILERAGLLESPGIGVSITVVALTSILVGTVVSVFIGKIPVKPFERLIYAMNSLAAGHYDTRLRMRVPRIGKDVEDSFNIMAEELQNTELLRSDFVNNFSHEFKTPLVSIQGFARLLQKDNLPEEKRQEYLSIIASESARLADMATKVLDLTKLENQNILTDISDYNLSEQLRECILLLERRWAKKDLTFDAEFDEYDISGNEEMLKQVWINLLDNAIKFSPEGGTISVSIHPQDDAIQVTVSNTGDPIPEDEQARIFQKFYQADTSHTSQGNGIGLAIVKRIVTLHEGTVNVTSTNGQTAFTVTLTKQFAQKFSPSAAYIL